MIDVEGAILAGGQSRRMGCDKSALVLGRSTVLERIGAAMAPVTSSRTRVIGNQVTDAKGYPVQPDLRPGMGPLSGIHAALATAKAPAVLVVACDLPFVTSDFLAGLCERLSSDADAVAPRLAGRAVPVCAIYRTRCLRRLESCLDRREWKAQALLRSLTTVFVDEDVLTELDPDGVCLKNLNTPEDLDRARTLAAAMTSALK